MTSLSLSYDSLRISICTVTDSARSNSGTGSKPRRIPRLDSGVPESKIKLSDPDPSGIVWPFSCYTMGMSCMVGRVTAALNFYATACAAVHDQWAGEAGPVRWAQYAHYNTQVPLPKGTKT